MSHIHQVLLKKLYIYNLHYMLMYKSFYYQMYKISMLFYILVDLLLFNNMGNYLYIHFHLLHNIYNFHYNNKHKMLNKYYHLLVMHMFQNINQYILSFKHSMDMKIHIIQDFQLSYNKASYHSNSSYLRLNNIQLSLHNRKPMMSHIFWQSHVYIHCHRSF